MEVGKRICRDENDGGGWSVREREKRREGKRETEKEVSKGGTGAVMER